MMRGTIYNIGINYYEVLDKTEGKILMRWVNGYIGPQPNNESTVRIPVRVARKGFTFKQKEVIDFPITKPNKQWVHLFKQFYVSRERVSERKANLRLSLNNIIARIFLGKKSARTLTDNIIKKRVYGTAQSN